MKMTKLKNEEYFNSKSLSDILSFLSCRKDDVYEIYMNTKFNWYPSISKEDFLEDYPFKNIIFERMHFQDIHYYKRNGLGWSGNLQSANVKCLDMNVCGLLEVFGIYPYCGGWNGIWYYQFYIYAKDFKNINRKITKMKLAGETIPSWI